MAELKIEDLSQSTYDELRQRASRSGRTVGDEARAVLEATCQPAIQAADSLRRIKNLIDQIYGGKKPTGVVEEFLAERRGRVRRG